MLSSISKCKKAVLSLIEKICIFIRCVIQAWVIVLLIVGLELMKQQYVLNKVSVNRNRHKTKLFIDQLMEM